MSVILANKPNTTARMDEYDVAEISSDEDPIPIEESLSYKHSYGDIEFPSENLKCLDDKQYLSDSIIQFYLAYLMNGCDEEIAKRIHIFDSMLMGKLEAAFGDVAAVNGKGLLALNKWTSKVDMFEKDFVIFPICSEQHWFVIVVCYPMMVEELPRKNRDRQDKENQISPHQPSLFVMDSLACRAKKYTISIRDFLDYTWRLRSETLKRFSANDMQAIYPKLPLQTNSYDCGLYMLAYCKTFLEDPDVFYQLVSRPSSKGNDELEDLVTRNLETLSRSSIRSLIRQICESSVK